MSATQEGRRWRVIAVCFAVRALAGAAIALPWALVVAGFVGAVPGGDEVLWDKGGMLLVETARLVEPRLGALGGQSLGVGIVGLFLWLLPLGALISVAARPEVCPWRSSFRAYGSVALLQGFIMLLQSLLLAAGIWLAGVVRHGPDEFANYGALMAVAASTLGCCFVLGVVQDVVRVHLFREERGVMHAVSRCFEIGMRVWLNLLGAASWRGLAFVSVAVGVSVWLLRGGGSHGPVVGMLLVQAVTLSCVLLRSSWLARARALAFLRA